MRFNSRVSVSWSFPAGRKRGVSRPRETTRVRRSRVLGYVSESESPDGKLNLFFIRRFEAYAMLSGRMPVYAATIFLSAFLLFQIQPLIAKFILPWFGASAAVWSA